MIKIFVKYQPNPRSGDIDSAGDCVVRAISRILDKSWEDTYLQLTAYAFGIGDVFTANYLWISYLLNHGFREHSLISMCKDCYTLERFAKDIGPGRYVVSDGHHVVAVIREPNDAEARFFDSFNSKGMIPIFYLEKIEPLDSTGGVKQHGNE